ncbi:MAG: branched-chain amino acid transporter AzlC [Paracoccus denitrificans]|nr:MAG: branched-chain amino acid transporter AzlC [Paracoccus denitrificans]PZO83150.1 MAG: branched-chain amino acid transporter AzlC [Paracoccus denitrificans]
MSSTDPGAADARAARIYGETPAQAFWRGATHALPFILILMPMALLFGVVAQTAGLSVMQTMGFSVLVLAGASQFTAVALLSDHVSTIFVIVTALAVNLRMAMYSASLVPYFGKASVWQKAVISYLLIDQNFALASQHYETFPRLTITQRLAYFLGLALITCLPWAVFTFVGATVGNLIPAQWPLDFAIPVAFLAMIAPMIRSWAHAVAAGVAIVFALILSGMPSGTGLLIAAPLGMIAGASFETLRSNRARDLERDRP